MAYFDELLRQAITVRNNRAPASNTADLVGGVLVGIVTALQMLLDDKQDELTFDTAPTADSQNPVTSDGIYQALQAIDLSACEKIVNKVTSINAQSTNVQYPTAKLLYDSLQALSGIYAAIVHTHAIADIINLQTELNARQLVSNLVTAITAQSTDQQYPSAKLLYDQLALKANQATTYTKTEVDALISALSTISFVVVQQLPTSDIQTNVIYLVPAAQPGQSNIYNEYIYVNNNWELIGSTAIDLSGYEQTVNKVTALTAQSTNVQYPSAKCVYDEIQNLYTLIYYYHATTYYVRGTSSNLNGTETLSFGYKDDITGTTTTVNETVNVDAEGNWEFSYVRKKVITIRINSTTITSLDFSAADDFNLITSLRETFSGCTALTTVDLSNAIFENVTTTGQRYYGMFNGCTALTTVNLSNATFKSVTQTKCMFYNCSALTTVIMSSATFESLVTTGSITQASNSDNMFFNCASLVELDLSSATFDVLQETVSMFYGCNHLQRVIFNEFASFSALQNASSMLAGCTALTSVNFENATFDSLTNATNMFASCTSLASINLGNATFDNLINAGSARYQGMFYGCSALVNVNLSKATFKSLTGAQGMFYGCSSLVSLDLSTATFEALTDAGTVNYNGSGMFSGCTSLATLDLTSATFESLQKNNQMFAACRALTNITNNTPGKFPLSLALNAAPLNYTSMLTVANWLKDLTGQTAQSVTFKSSAWNALTAAEQSNIDTILSGKNWTRVLA